jgi:predicted transcriptional regulator
MANEIENYLKDLGFNKNEIKVYVALTKLGEAKALEVAKKANLPRTTAISILNKLAEENYLTTHVYKGVTNYWIESPKAIANIFEHKIDVANALDTLLSDMYRKEAHFPTALVIDTKKGIKNFIEKLLTNLEKKTVIYTIDTPSEGNYAKIFPEEMNEVIFGVKKKKGIVTHTLVPFGSFKNITNEKIIVTDIFIKEMPEKIQFKGSLWIIGDSIIHFSGNPPFAVLIKHEAVVLGIKSLYNFMWGMSELKHRPGQK